jgi:hypothetical protein
VEESTQALVVQSLSQPLQHQENIPPNAHQLVRDHSLRLQHEASANLNQQEELRKLKQFTEQMGQQLDNALQKIQNLEHQAQQNIQNSEMMQQQTSEIHQKIHSSCMKEANRGNGLSVDQMREIPQGQQDMLNRYSIVHYRIQALFSSLSDNPQFPQFFIVLPRGSGIDTERGNPWLFRLHFLCECDFHTMNTDGKSACELHMTNHPGYDLKRPKAFFNKYGSYVLTMMYLIKYGAMTLGFVVPPLAHSKLISRIEATQEQTGLTRKSIMGLMDDTTAYLEDLTCAVGNGMDVTSHWSLTPADLESYLNVNESEHFPGGLYRLMTQE